MSSVIRADWQTLVPTYLYREEQITSLVASHSKPSKAYLLFMRAQFTLRGVTSQRPSSGEKVSMHAQRWRLQM